MSIKTNHKSFYFDKLIWVQKAKQKESAANKPGTNMIYKGQPCRNLKFKLVVTIYHLTPFEYESNF